MSRITYRVASYRVEIGADGENVRNENFNIHMTIEVDPNRSDTTTGFYRDWKTRKNLWIAFTNGKGDEDDHSSNVTTWFFSNEHDDTGRRISRRSTSSLKAYMAPSKFAGVLAAIEAARGVDIAMHPAVWGSGFHHEYAAMTLITHEKSLG